jgi:hypothetical protein
MKDYKLIKEFPGSLALIGMIRTENEWKQTYDISSSPTDWPEFFEEVKVPLFISENRKEIYYDSDVYCVILKTYLIKKFNMSDKDVRVDVVNSYVKKSDYFKYFSTKEAAEEWIEENKPVFSIRYLSEIIDGCYYGKDKKFDLFKFKDDLGL